MARQQRKDLRGKQEAVAFEIDLDGDDDMISGKGAGHVRGSGDSKVAYDNPSQNRINQAAPLGKNARNSSLDTKVDDDNGQGSNLSVLEPSSRRAGGGIGKEATAGRNRRGWGAPVDPFKPQAAAPPRVSPRTEASVEVEEEVSTPMSGRDRGWYS